MKILIAGGTGFIGQYLQKAFASEGHTVSILTRNPTQPNEILWDANSQGTWIQAIENIDVLINLTGKSVNCRYNERNKEEILASRLQSTRILQEAIGAAKNPPKIWLNASSATIYADSHNHLNTESNGIIGDDFSMGVCKAWESAFFETQQPGIRKAAMRISIVLGNNGGAFPKFKTITQWGLGGKQGNGNQWMSWIHMEDLFRAIKHIIATPSLIGPINITAPEPVQNNRFMEILRNTLKVSIGLPAPKFLLEIAAPVLGTETELLLKSRYVYPEKLLQSGFRFRFEKVADAIESLA